MEIWSTYVDGNQRELPLVYRDIESNDELLGKQIQAVHAFCFYGDKLVVVYSSKKDAWTVPGGRLEMDESASDALVREVMEEANMRVRAQQLIGYQEIIQLSGSVAQVRMVCVVEPYGPFVSDPDGDITQIALIDPSQYKKYFDWGEVGEHLIRKALELKLSLV